MTETILVEKNNSSELHSIISGFYVEDTLKSVLIRLVDGSSFWVPKRYLDSNFLTNTDEQQNFIIENWILKKIGYRQIDD